MATTHSDFPLTDDIRVTSEDTGWAPEKAVITPYLDKIAGTCGIPAMIAHRTGLTLKQVDQLIAKRPTFRKAVEAERRACMELIEYSIMKRAQTGDTNAARYLLELFAKERGFGKQEAADGPAQIVLRIEGAKHELTPDEWSARAREEDNG